MTRAARLQSAKGWLSTYTGNHVIQGYRKWFGVDTLCAMSELQMLGIQFDTEYVTQVQSSEQGRIQAKQAQKLKRRAELVMDLLPDSDDNFAFIVGYTSGGVPYGLTWEEAGLDESWLEDEEE